MHILVVTQYFWPENFRINDIALGLKAKGYQITVLTGQPNYPEGKFYQGYSFWRPDTEEYSGIKIIRVPLIPRGKSKKLELILNYLSFVFFASLIAPFRCKDKYDLIFVWQTSPVTVGLPALLLKKIKKAPIMFYVLDLWPESLSATGAVTSPKILKLVENLVKFIYNGCDKILVQSMAFIPEITKFGIDKEKILYFPSTAEEIYKPTTIDNNAPEKKNMPDGFKVMFAGNIGVAQDFKTILSAAEKLKDHKTIQWIILGDGRMLPWVKEQVEKRALSNVHLLGRHPTESMPRYFALADVMLITLKKEHIFAVTIPAKTQSYLACGKPIIAALDGEGARIVEEAQAGVSVPAESPDKLAEAVLKMYKMSENERNIMGLNARQYSENNFDRKLLLNRLNTWIINLIQ